MDDGVGAGERRVHAHPGADIRGARHHAVAPALEPPPVARDGDHLVSTLHEMRHEVAANKPGCSDDADLHALSLC